MVIRKPAGKDSQPWGRLSGLVVGRYRVLSQCPEVFADLLSERFQIRPWRRYYSYGAGGAVNSHPCLTPQQAGLSQPPSNGPPVLFSLGGQFGSCMFDSFCYLESGKTESPKSRKSGWSKADARTKLMFRYSYCRAGRFVCKIPKPPRTKLDRPRFSHLKFCTNTGQGESNGPGVRWQTT